MSIDGGRLETSPPDTAPSDRPKPIEMARATAGEVSNVAETATGAAKDASHAASDQVRESLDAVKSGDDATPGHGLTTR